MSDYISTYKEHLQFLYDQYRLFIDTLTEEERTRADISTKLNRLRRKILEMQYLIDLAEGKIASSEGE